MSYHSQIRFVCNGDGKPETNSITVTGTRDAAPSSGHKRNSSLKTIRPTSCESRRAAGA